MAHILEQMVREFIDAHVNARFLSGVQTVELEVSLHHFSSVITIGSSSCSGTVDVGSHVMELLTVLVMHHWTSSSSGISSEHNSVIEEDTDDSGTGGGASGWGGARSFEESLIPLIVGEIKA